MNKSKIRNKKKVRSQKRCIELVEMCEVRSKNLFLIVFSLTFFSLFHFSLSSYSQEDTITKHFSANNPVNTAISITNPTDSFSIFSISLNNKFWKDIEEMKNEIIREAGNNKDSLYLYAWKFVCKNTYHSYPITTHDLWITTTTIHINSLGFGNCGKHAIVLAKLWKKMGYESRVWMLKGHVVPEVYYEGNWHVLDPDESVYYLNDSNKIASVKELSENPEYITKPKIIVNNNQFNNFKNTQTADLYTTVNDNIIDNRNSEDVITKFIFELPPHSTLKLPGIYYKDFITDDSLHTPYYANCIIKIPPNWTGNIKNYLVLANVKGKGNIMINDVTYSINDSLFIKKISSFNTFFSNIFIKEHTDTISLIYFISPKLSEIKKDNTLIIKGSNIKDLEINTINIPDSLSIQKYLLQQYFLYKLNKRKELLSYYLSANLPCLENNQINTKKELYNTLTKYYKCTNAGSKKDIKIIIKKVKKAFNKLPKDYNYDKFFKYINNDIPKECFFDDIKNAPADDFQNMFILNKRKKIN